MTTPKRDEAEAVALAREAMLQAHAWIKGCIMDGYVGDKTIAKLDAALAAIAALDDSRARDKGDGWFDISTAPKDGTRILGAQQHTVEVIFWAGEWFNQSAEMSLWAAFPPTHWRELPVPPAEIIAPAPSQSEAIRAEVIAQGVDPNSDEAERMGRVIGRNMLRKAEGK